MEFRVNEGIGGEITENVIVETRINKDIIIMVLFEMVQTKKFQGKPSDMPLFEYFSQSEGQQFAKARLFWNHVFQYYPSMNKEQLRNDFCSIDNKLHISTCYELYVFWIFNQMGFQTKNHPDISPDTNEKPDFLFYKDGTEFIVEATCLLTSANAYTSNIHKKKVIDNINMKVRSDKFLIFIRFDGKWETTPNCKRICSEVSQFLLRLELISYTDTSNPIASRRFAIGGKVFVVNVYLKTEQMKNANLPICPFYQSEPASRDISDEKLLGKIKYKAKKRYKDYQCPIIFAVNIGSNLIDDIQIKKALYGKNIEQSSCEMGSNEVNDYNVDDRTSCFWYNIKEPQNKRIPAILINSGIEVVKYTQEPKLFFSPHVDSNLPFISDYFTRYIFNNNKNHLKLIEAVGFEELMLKNL